MKITYRNLTRLGMTVAMLGTAVPGAAGETGKSGEARTTGGLAAVAADSGEGGAIPPGDLPLEKRLAFMRGHVEAGLALYRAGAPGEAAPHLMHPVSETHAAEREGLEALGFDSTLFVKISEALEAGTASSEIREDISRAEENLALLADRAGGAPQDILIYLLDTTLLEYRAGVMDGTVVNAGEYADAYGFVTVAADYAAGLEGEAGQRVRAELSRLRGLWPHAPVAASEPASIDAVAAQVSRVQLELTGVR